MPWRLLLLWVAIVGAAAVQRTAAEDDCRAQMAKAFGLKNPAYVKWVDTDTPSGECTKDLGNGTLQLVFSDEFEEAGRGLSAGSKDPKWTAEDMYYFPTQDEEVYKPEQVEIVNGSAVVTFAKKTGNADSQQPDGELWKYIKPYTSGFVTGWNKFCFTGGYVEASVRLPGDDFYPGLWPAFWMMGNLGRAGYMETTDGFWAYSYSTCLGSASNAWSDLPAQNLSACTDPRGFNRSIWGMDPRIGRGAPEIDLLEVRVHPHNDGTPSAHGPNYRPPEVSQTLQMGPLLPPGRAYNAKGMFYPGSGSQFNTRENTFRGNLLQNSISGVSDLSAAFWSDFHTFGVDWSPGESLKWYIDGTLVYELTKEALTAVNEPNTPDYLGPRLIPVEPMYLIFNLAMAKDFSGRIDKENLVFPSHMLVDYVRVYQSADAGLKVGCSPPDMPTEQYIACHRSKYITRKSDNVLIPAKCTENGARLGGLLRFGAGAVLSGICMLLLLAAL